MAVPYETIFRAAAGAASLTLPASERANLYPVLVATAEHESSFRANAVHKDANGTEDVGIMQLNLQAQGVPYLFAASPATAIPYAARLLASNYRACGSWTGALEKYNSGQCAGDSGYAGAVLALAPQYGYRAGGGHGGTAGTAAATTAATATAAGGWLRAGLVVAGGVVIILALSRI